MMNSEHKRRWHAIDVITPALYSLVITTGALALGLLAAAALTGATIGDLYFDAFPRLRGPGGLREIPTIAYAIFIGYVVVTSQIAITIRRRMNRHPKR